MTSNCVEGRFVYFSSLFQWNSSCFLFQDISGSEEWKRGMEGMFYYFGGYFLGYLFVIIVVVICIKLFSVCFVFVYWFCDFVIFSKGRQCI